MIRLATIVEASEVAWGRGREAGYPWHEWFDGQTRQLTRNKDFKIKPESLRGQAYTAARRHKVKIRTKILDKDTLAIQRLGGTGTTVPGQIPNAV